MFLRTLITTRLFPGIRVGRGEMLFLANNILASKIPGCVVECGCFRGGSTSIISAACKKAGRKLYVFDSFCGLPTPGNSDADHHILADPEIHRYAKGFLSASLETVKANVARFGALEVCSFQPGYFEDTLPLFKETVAAVFCDADLVESIKTCLRYLWPLMPNGATFFTHEAHHLEVAKLFYDDRWWNETLQQDAPGLIGAGSGLGVGFRKNRQRFHGSALGFVVKNPETTRVSVESGHEVGPHAAAADAD